MRVASSTVRDEWKHKFTLQAEDYLHGLITMVNEMVRRPVAYMLQDYNKIIYQSRWAVNAVTLGDYERPIRISIFVKSLFAGFSAVSFSIFLNSTDSRISSSI